MGDTIDSTNVASAVASETGPGSVAQESNVGVAVLERCSQNADSASHVPDSEAPSESGTTKANADSTRLAPRPSGLKPPSKIGRLCAHSAPKAAIPASPRSTDGSSTETLRKLSEDYSRKHLADLVEADEEGEGCGSSATSADRAGRSYRKASSSSTYSVTSMDALWEKHPRKLSEAGLRRSSDHSVVLTEDTDSFIIGDRVWVGGSKPGQIAYIGETQFAPGEWAGIVLDEPIGKNDGSVAGTRYFQCAERRGVFSRLTRLTRAPLVTSRSPHAASPASDAGSVFTTPSVSAGARQRRALSPNGSVRSAVSSKMNMSVTSTAGGGGELRLGERVIVSSSQGSKAGTLRYVGLADFAPGLWCGVELDDPIGKNDGSVEGKRYFECSPRFGLFAPASKVSRSPSNRRPGACAIHSNGRPLRRSNSRDSLTSLGTSIVSSVRRAPALAGQRASGPRASSTPVSAKNALQELLREKQQHLERLMRERELERSEVAKLTLQAERATTQLAHAVKHSAFTTSENESLKAELMRLGKQLEDERQRAEELLFRTEEDNIHKEDYDKFKQAAEAERAVAERRIQELEAEVALLAASAETVRAVAAAAADKHAAEQDTLAAAHRDEMHAAQMLSSELQKLLDEAYALLKEKENEKDSLGKSMTEELTRSRTESERALTEAKSKLAVAQTEFEAQMSVLNAKLQMAETKLETEKQNSERLVRDNSQAIVDLNSKIALIQATLDDKTHELNKVLGSSKEQELSHAKEIIKLKMEMSAKILDLEQLTDSNKKYETASKALETELTNMRDDFAKKMNEYESLLNETSQLNDKYLAEVSELRQMLVLKTNELEKVLNDSNNSSTTSAKQIADYKEIISERDKEIVKLKHDFEEKTAEFNKSHTIIAEEHKKLIEDKSMQIEKLTKEIEIHHQIIEKNKSEFEALNLKVNSNVDEIKILINKNNELNNTICELNKTISELNAKISKMELENAQLERQLHSSNEKCSELQKAKEKVETEYLNLTSHSTDSNDEINKLSQYLRETEKELQDLRDKFREKNNEHEHTEQELNQLIIKLQHNFTLEKDSLTKTIENTQDNLVAAEGKIRELDSQIHLLKQLSDEQNDKQIELLNEKSQLDKEIEAGKLREIELKSQLDDLKNQSEKSMEEFKHKIDILKADGENSEIKLKEKVDQLVEAQNDLNNRLEQAQKNEELLQKQLEDLTANFDNKKSVFIKELNQKEVELSTIKKEINQSVSDGVQRNASIEEKESIIKDLNFKMALLDVDIKSNMEVIAEKERQILVSGEELTKCLKEKQEIEQRLAFALTEITMLQQKQDSLIANRIGNESTIEEKQDKINTLSNDIESITNDKSNIEKRYQELYNQLENMTAQHQDLLENYSKSKAELSIIVEEKDSLIKAETEKYFKATVDIKCLEEEKEILHKTLEEKNIILEEKEKQLTQLTENLQKDNCEYISQIENLNKEIENLINSHKLEVETFKKSIESLEISLKEYEGNLEIINKKNDHVEELQTLLSKAEADIKQLSNINNGQKANYEDLNKQVQFEYDKLKKETKQERHTLKDKLCKFEKALQESNDKINVEISKQAELQKKLEVAEKHAQELVNQVELLTVHQTSSNAQQDSLLEKITLDMQALRKSSTETISNHENMIGKLKIDVENKINDLLKKDDRIAMLEEELKNQKVKTEIAQREKHLIQQESAAKEKENIRKENYDNGDTKTMGDEGALKLLEEKQLVEGQVDFLNSVIVDMQRKNEALLARVQALETGFSPDSASPNHFQFDGKKKEIAPRLFCDICDVFDAHDTEDCPRQSAEPAPPASESGAARKPPPPRPYCDICEVFGHATENCDEEETF